MAGLAPAQSPIPFPSAAEIAKITGDAEPFFEVWNEDVVYGVVDVAMDGSVLLFSLQGDPHPDKRRGSKIYLKRSEDGGDTWSDHQLVGEPINLDVEALGIGPYDGKGWGNDEHHRIATLGTSVVDETTGKIMLFLTALHPALSMYKSGDHGKTWRLEDIEMKTDARGFLSIPNGACDPGITLRHGPHKGRLLVPSRVMPNYRKQDEKGGYTNAVYSDDGGKTWIPSEPFPLDGTGESGLVELSDGTIYLNSRTHIRKGNRWVVHSDDSGETWRDLHQDDELFDGPPDEYGCKAALLRLDREDGDILLFSSPSPDLSERKNIRVWVSFDGGKTWPLNRLIKRGPGNYTWLAQGRKGTSSEGYIYLLAGKDWMARFNMAWLLGPADPEVLLSKRERFQFSDLDLFRSAEGAEGFVSADPKFESSPAGFRLEEGQKGGRVLTQRMILPSAEMRVSYHAPEGGALRVWLMDDSDTRRRDSHPMTGSHQIDLAVDWQDGSIGEWVGAPVYVQFELEGDVEVFGISFGGLPDRDPGAKEIEPAGGSVLPPRHDYRVNQNPPFVRSVRNVNTTEGDETGFKLADPKRAGHVLSHAFSLPDDAMELRRGGAGTIVVALFDESGARVATSEPIAGGEDGLAKVVWDEGSPSNLVSKTVSVRFDLSGGAQLFGLRFEEVFWE